MKKRVLLSFDVEEFDLPREHGGKISVKEGVDVSMVGLKRILEVLEKTGVRATFFCTGNFAKEKPEMINEILRRGHEVGGHGVDHFRPKKSDVRESKKILEGVLGREIRGWRQPRMMKIDFFELKKQGFLYDSSVNPAFIPGRYNNLKTPRKPFLEEAGVVEIPTSVATKMRVPLFWLALHLFPFMVYQRLSVGALRHDGYFATYFHPWEFGAIRGFREVPRYIKVNSGEKLAERLEKLILALKKEGGEFVTYGEFAEMVREGLEV